MATRYRILDTEGRRYLELNTAGTVLPNGEITSSTLRHAHLYAHTGIRTFVLETNRLGQAVNISERDRAYHEVDGWVGFTIDRDEATSWDDAKGYGRVESDDPK